MQFQNYYSQYPYIQFYNNPIIYYPPQFNQFFYFQTLRDDESPNIYAEVKTQENVQKNQSIRTLDILENEKNQKKKKPAKKKNQDANYLNKCQKDDRNLNSIVLRNFVNFINNHPGITKIVEKIIKGKQINIKASYYCEQFRNRLPPRQSYVGVGKLRGFIEKGKLNYEIKLITLILLKKFIDTDFFTVLINSKKVSRSARQKQLKHGKKFWREFLKQYL